MGRRINDGDRTGMKLDRYRNSRSEPDVNQNDEDPHYAGVSRSTANTINGPWAENRGRRSATEGRSQWDNSSFEDGRSGNWRKNRDLDDLYDRSYDRGNRFYGGAQLDHEGSHFGKGPRGYKRSDDQIFHEVCDALTMSAGVDASNIEVLVKDGIVYLNGSVHDRQMKKLAELEIENVSGVKDVQNHLSPDQSKDLH